MHYCTLQDIERAMSRVVLIQLSNDDPVATEPDADVLERAQVQADELIDAALRVQYQLPVATVPTVVSEIAVNLVRHWLWARRPQGDDVPKVISESYKASLKLLDSIRDGKLSLGLPNGKAAPTVGKFRMRASRRRFSDAALARQPGDDR